MESKRRGGVYNPSNRHLHLDPNPIGKVKSSGSCGRMGVGQILLYKVRCSKRRVLRQRRLFFCEKLQLLLVRISVVKTNVLPRFLFFFQTVSVLRNDASFKQWQKDITRFIGHRQKPRVKDKILQGAKEKGGLGLSNFKFYFAACCLA